jgi:hypothetical protein
MAAAGFPLGRHLLVEPRHDNADGYWEDGMIVRRHETFLAARFGSAVKAWSLDGLDDALGAAKHADAERAAKDALREILSDRFSERDVFTFKDPRTARLLPLWRELASEVDADFMPVFVLRHPSAVAASLQTRNEIPHGLGEVMWLRSTADILRHAPEALATTILYEDWFARPYVNLARVLELTKLVGVPPDPFDVSLVKSAARHHATGAVLLPLAAEVYERLAAREEGVAEELLAKIDATVAAFGGWRGLGAMMASLPGQRRATALPLSATARPGADVLMPDRVEISNGNPWTAATETGFLLHANAPRAPATTLTWRGVRGGGKGRLKGLVAAGAGAPELWIVVRAGATGGVSTTLAIVHTPPGVVVPIDVVLPDLELLDIGLEVLIAPTAPANYGAGVLINALRLVPDMAPGRDLG